MNKKQLLKNLQENTYCRLGVSKIQGVGVFAIRDIPKGVNPFPCSYNTYHKGNSIGFSSTEIQNLPAAVQIMVKDFCVEEEGKIYIPSCGFNRIDISFFINHSTKPNVVEKIDEGEFLTSRNIKKGEELTLNYIEYEKEDKNHFS